jgi:hypothetical protein
MKNHPIHMPWMVAYTYQGEKKWSDYNFSAEASYAENTFADSRVQRLTIGRDGFLYLGGYIHGGDYVWRHDPHDVKQRVKVEAAYDSYSSASNMGRGIDQAYFAKFDPETGKILQGQVLLTRVQADGGGKPAQIQIKGLQADEQGNLHLTGYCEKYIKNRDQQTVNGIPVGEYHKPEPFLLAAAWGIGVRQGRAALVAEVYEGTLITTGNALLKEPPGPRNGYLVFW